jgi:16S rRNA (guanine1207-N2)-methyltransferase
LDNRNRARSRAAFRHGRGSFFQKRDEGSRILIETAFQSPPEPGARLCDLGCGWGAMSCFAAALAPQIQVFGCDVNARAVALARLNAQTNELENALFWCGDGLDASRDNFFDVVLCNPPVRAGNETIARLFDGAHRCLKSGGTLWVVLRTAQGAKSWQKRLAAQFGVCETVTIHSGYRILRCGKQSADGRRQDAGS